MNIENLTTSLQLIKPEIAISILLVVIVLFDLIFDKRKNLLPVISIIGLLITAYFVVEQFSMNNFAFEVGTLGKGLLAVDSFSAFFKMIVILSTIFIILFSVASSEIINTGDRHGEYYTLIMGMVLGMFLISSASDLILIYLSIELMSLSSYILAGFLKTVDRSSEASLKYVIYGSVASGIMLFGISILYGLTGTTNLYEMNALLQQANVGGFTFIFAGIMVLGGIGFKVSIAPFHFWTPDVYEGAPIAITAYLSIASKAAGFALLIRFMKVTFFQSLSADGSWIMLGIIDWQRILIALAILTMTLGNFAALWQDNIKRMLAYSSIAHAGYLLLAVAIFSNDGIIAVLVYFAIYLFMNLGAFFVVMLIANKIGSEEMDDYKGMGSSTAFLGIALSIFLLSLAGLPPTAGFIGKFYIFMALLNADMIVVAIITLLNTVVAYYYYVRVLKNLYLVRTETSHEKIQVSFGNMIIVLLLLIPVFVFGIYFTPIVNLAKNSAAILGF
ncbi:MAG TPA: NADH-quinone oxidoreductase subunit N [Ignavibacteriaceae bacterium]|nr:NADH-quinone oxidoreductase subunit N [Ignavibacteriaceae bacterium]